MKLVALGLLLLADHAYASHCGASSDDDSSPAFSNDDTSTAPSMPSRPWSEMTAMTIDIGFATRTLASPLGSQTGSVTHDDRAFAYRVTGPKALETAYVGSLRIGKPLPYNLYTAGELELGALHDADVSTEMLSSGPQVTPSSVLMISGLGVVGVGGRVTHALDLGVEVAGGVRALAYGFDSRYGACETSSTVTATQAVLEARARASLWLTPHVALSALAGKSALDNGMVGGLAIGITNHAFAGR